MNVSFSKKRTIISSIVLVLMAQILWIYPEYIQNIGNRRFTIVVFLLAILFSVMKLEMNTLVEGIVSFLAMGISAYFLFKYMQASLGGVGTMLPGGVILNVGLIILFMFLLFLITNSTRISGIVSAALLIPFSFLNMFVVYFRGKPIAATDVHSLKTALGVSSNYTLWWNDHVVRYILLLFVLCIVFSQLNFKIEKGKIRAIVAGVGALAVVLLMLTVYNVNRLEEKDFSLQQFVPIIGVQQNGYLLDFYLNLQNLSVSKPSGYDLEIIEEMYQEYVGVDALAIDGEAPNILIIMNESYFDLTCLGDITYTEDPLRYFNSLEENTIRGNLLSSVYGGNTPNSEYECLTGGTMAFYPKDSIVYQNFLYSEIPSTVSLLETYDYETLSMHPYNKIYWERERVYPEVLGFDSFISQDEIENPILVRDYISDQEVFDILLEHMRTDAEENQLFNFTITMQNHGGYYFGMTDITAPEINNPYIDEYLSITKITDDAFKSFIKELEEFDEPTIVCMFGDHQPRFPDDVYDTIWSDVEMTEEEMELTKHIVPFVIWANYDIEEEEIPLTSINYLSPMIMEAAGIPLSPYYQYLMDLQEAYPVVSSLGCYNSDMQFYQVGEEMDALPEMNEYEIIQYNYIHDQRNRVEEFFSNSK